MEVWEPELKHETKNKEDRNEVVVMGENPLVDNETVMSN